MDEYKDSASAVIADVDCTAAGKSLCEKHDIGGYPTIKYGDPKSLQDYDGGRDLASLKTFAAENLGPVCGPKNLDLCDENEKKFIEKYKKWDVDELDTKIEEGEEKLTKIRDAAEKEVQKLKRKISDIEERIKKEEKKRDDKLAKETTKLGIKHMKAIVAARKEEL